MRYGRMRTSSYSAHVVSLCCSLSSALAVLSDRIPMERLECQTQKAEHENTFPNGSYIMSRLPSPNLSSPLSTIYHYKHSYGQCNFTRTCDSLFLSIHYATSKSEFLNQKTLKLNFQSNVVISDPRDQCRIQCYIISLSFLVLKYLICH